MKYNVKFSEIYDFLEYIVVSLRENIWVIESILDKISRESL